MKIWYRASGWWAIRCDCGFTCEAITMEWLGRQYDVHLSGKFPLHSERRLCHFPVTVLHSIPFEYDPTPLQPGEHHVIERAPGPSHKKPIHKFGSCRTQRDDELCDECEDYKAEMSEE